MRKYARWMLISAAALLLVSRTWAVVQAVDPDGTLYSVEVVQAPGAHSPGATALKYSRLFPNGIQVGGMITPTLDSAADRDPTLVQTAGASGPILIWTRTHGSFDQIAYSRFDGLGWTQPGYLTDTPRNHQRPQAGVDASGTGYLMWVETGDNTSVMLATFDPLTGNLISSPRDFFLELVRHSPPVWLSQDLLFSGAHGRPQADGPYILPDGGIEVPVIPPAQNPKIGEPVGGTITLSPSCTKVVAAISRNRALWIGVLQNGVVLNYYRSVVPEGAPDNYVSLLLKSLLNQNCQ
ncbi:MAG: hypothetical protein L0Z52_02370 [Acidobacteria bacterium]|nr:hypothetical protein [Acidobacteriota bacterium]